MNTPGSASARPLELILDARKIGDGGIGVYIENLVDGLLELPNSAQRVSVTLLVTPEYRLGEGAAGAGPEGGGDSSLKRWSGRVQMVSETAAKYSAAEYLLLPYKQSKLLARADVYHSPHYTLPFFTLPFFSCLSSVAPRLRSFPRLRSVVTIHDLIHITHPDSALHRVIGSRLISSALSRADAVLTVSEHSKRVIEHCFPSRKSGGDTPQVIPNALRIGLKRPSEEQLRMIATRFDLTSRDYLLWVGTDRPHKGLDELIKAFTVLQTLGLATGLFPGRLVCVGDNDFARARRVAASLGIEDSCKFLGKLPASDLSALYGGAAALVVSSQEEGFCLPALEAMAVGTTVVSTPLPSVHEICGELAFFARGFDSESLGQAILAAFSQPDVSKERADRGVHRAAAFSRREVAARHLACYERLVYGVSPDRPLQDLGEVVSDGVSQEVG